VPGSDERKMNKASTLKVDTIVLDLEDGVTLNKKISAREMVFSTLEVMYS
jgi:citrate lyase subunit beta-like protein